MVASVVRPSKKRVDMGAESANLFKSADINDRERHSWVEFVIKPTRAQLRLSADVSQGEALRFIRRTYAHIGARGSKHSQAKCGRWANPREALGGTSRIDAQLRNLIHGQAMQGCNSRMAFTAVLASTLQ